MRFGVAPRINHVENPSCRRLKSLRRLKALLRLPASSKSSAKRKLNVPGLGDARDNAHDCGTREVNEARSSFVNLGQPWIDRGDSLAEFSICQRFTVWCLEAGQRPILKEPAQGVGAAGKQGGRIKPEDIVELQTEQSSCAEIVTGAEHAQESLREHERSLDGARDNEVSWKDRSLISFENGMKEV